MANRRTDLALEAHALWRAAAGESASCGARIREAMRRGCRVTSVEIPDEACANALGKPKGLYVTLEVGETTQETFSSAVRALAEELRELISRSGCGKNVLVVGLGNDAMTPDAIGPRAAARVLATRHLRRERPFAALNAVSVLTPGVLARTGMESFELVRSAADASGADLILVIDALASQSLGRVCTTVQMSDSGIVPGSGVGNHRAALDRRSLGVPVLVVGVPTVVDAATLCLDVLEEAGADAPDPRALRGHESVMVTPREIDEQVETFSRLIGYGIDLALQPELRLGDLTALLG